MTSWTDLRDEIQDLRTAAYDVATALSDEGKDAERVFGRVDGYNDVLLRMDRIGDEPARDGEDVTFPADSAPSTPLDDWNW